MEGNVNLTLRMGVPISAFGIIATSVLLSALARAEASGPLCFVANSLPAMHSSPDRGGYLFLGHELAMKSQPSVQIAKYESKGTDESLVSTVTKMSSDGCKVILGLFTSKEALLAGKLLKGKDVIGVSASASHVGLKELYPAVVTAVPAADAYTSKVIEHLQSRKEQIVVVVQPDDLYSTAMTTNIYNQWKGAKPPRIDIRGNSVIDMPSSIKRNSPLTIVFTTYPVPSVDALSRLHSLGIIGKKTTLIGSASWVFDLAAFRNSRDLLVRAEKVLVPETLDRTSEKYKEFEKKFIDKFSIKPENLAAYSYDTTLWVAKCWTRSTKTTKEFLACLNTEPFNGATGRILLEPGSPFPSRKVFMADLLERL